MRNSMLAVALGAAMAVVLCACGGSAASSSGASDSAGASASSVSADAPATSASAASASDSASVASASASGAQASAGTQADEEYYTKLVEQNLDMSQYSSAYEGLSSDNFLDAPIESFEVAGKALRFGMTYDEVIDALGSDVTVPDGLADVETKGGHVVVFALKPFKTVDGSAFRLSFAGESGGTVKEGGTLAGAGNEVVDNPAPIVVNGVTTGSSMADVVAALGSPTSIKGESGEASSLEFSYRYKGPEGASQVSIGFDHDAVATISAQGPMK